MKSLLPILLGLLQAASVSAQSPPADGASPAGESQKCGVSGTVFRKDTGEPLSKAKVTLFAAERPDDSTFAISDAGGHFLLDELPCHSYSLNVSHQGFVEASYGQRKTGDSGAVLALSRGQKMTDLVFKLQRTAIITGRVYDENGELVQKATVRVLRRTGRGKQRSFEETARVETNDLGEFRLFDLDPGRCYLAVSYSPWSVLWGFGPRPARQLRKKGYPTLYYPSTTDPTKAQVVVLSPGDEITPIDFRLQLTSMNTVSGKILNLPGTPLRASAEVFLFPRGSELSAGSEGNLQSHTTDGSFAFYGVSPGSYYLQAMAFDSDMRTPRWFLQELDVGDADIEGLTFSFPPSTDLSGRVLWDGKKPGDLSDLTVLLYSTNENIPGGEPQALKPDGTFEFRNLTDGEYHPSVLSTSRDCYLKSARLGPTTSMTDGILAVHSPSDSGLEYVVSCRAPQVEGQVLTGDSIPAPGAFVVLVPEVSLRQYSWNYGEAKTDQNGRFLLKGMQPGDYKLFSWDSVEQGDWQDSDFLKLYEDQGIAVHLGEGDRKSVDLSLLEPPDNAPPPNE